MALGDGAAGGSFYGFAAPRSSDHQLVGVARPHSLGRRSFPAAHPQKVGSLTRQSVDLLKAGVVEALEVDCRGTGAPVSYALAAFVFWWQMGDRVDGGAHAAS